LEGISGVTAFRSECAALDLPPGLFVRSVAIRLTSAPGFDRAASPRVVVRRLTGFGKGNYPGRQ